MKSNRMGCLSGSIRTDAVNDNTDYWKYQKKEMAWGKKSLPSHATCIRSMRFRGKKVPLITAMGSGWQDAIGYLGDNTITSVRPSNLGLCSITAISAVSSAIRSSISFPSRDNVISRPRNITVTFTLSFLPMNFLM